MSLKEKISEMSHLELEELNKLVEQELTRRWKSYDENPEIFKTVISGWSTDRLERFIFMSEMEMEYNKLSSPSKTYEAAKAELEKRESEQENK